MAATGYVWQRMLAAIPCLCGQGSLEERIKNAAIATVSLNDDDLDGELGEDLRYILSWTAHNLDDGKLLKMPNDVEYSRLVDKMLHILLETHEI